MLNFMPKINMPFFSSNNNSYSLWGMLSLLESFKLQVWQKIIMSSIGFTILRAFSHVALTFGFICCCLSFFAGNFLFMIISVLSVVMILLNIDLASLSKKFGENYDLCELMNNIKDDMQESSIALKENNEQLKQEIISLQSKIKKLEGLLLGMEKIINDSHNLNAEQTTKFNEALTNIIAATELNNATAQAEFAKVLVDYEGVSDRLVAVTTALEHKTAELASTSSALCDTNKDFKKVCESLETITFRLEQLYKVGIISEKYLNSWSSQLQVDGANVPIASVSNPVAAAEIKQDFMGLQSFCDSLGVISDSVSQTYVAG